MDKTQAFVTGFVAAIVAGTILGVSGFLYLNAQEGKSKDKQQFSECVKSGGTYLKDRVGYPICIK